MSSPKSGRTPRSSRRGNGEYPPHMQSSFCAPGFGIYNPGAEGGGGGDAMSLYDSTSIPSGVSPLKKETISYNDYLSSLGSQQLQPLINEDGDWRNATGNENLTTYTSAYGGGPGGGDRGTANGSYLNKGETYLPLKTTPIPMYVANAPNSNTPRFDSGSLRSPQNAAGKVSDKQQPQYQQRQYHQNSNNSFSSNADGAPGIHSGIRNIVGEDVELGRNRKKDLLIDSLSKSDMITCLPGFKKRQTAVQTIRGRFSRNKSLQVREMASKDFKSVAEEERESGIQLAKRNLGIEEARMDRSKKKDHLIDSLSNSDMITCLPGFKKKVGTVRTAFPKLKPPTNSHRSSPEGNLKNKRGKLSWGSISRDQRIGPSSPHTPNSNPRQVPPNHGQNYQGQAARQNYPAQMAQPPYPGQMAYNYPSAGQVAYQNYPAQLARQNYSGQMTPQNYYGQMAYQNYPGQIPYQNYSGQMPQQNYQGQIPQSQNYQTYQGQIVQGNYQQPKNNLPPQVQQQRQAQSSSRGRQRLGMDDEADEEKEEVDEEFEALKEKTTKPQRIWQTSDELPDPALKTAVYKVELCKQIEEDRRRKADRVAREKEEDERMERKIREFHERERRRLEVEQQTRAELEGRYNHNRRNKMEKQRRRNEAFTIPRREIERRPRSRSSLLAEKLAHFGPSAADYDEPGDAGDPYYNAFANTGQNFSNDGMDDLSLSGDGSEDAKPARKPSPPIPVVRKKLIESRFGEEIPRRQISALELNFFQQLKTKLHSERDLVERRLQEKLESTHKNMNLLKYTMSQNKLAH